MGSVWLAVSLDYIVEMSGGDTLSAASLKGNVRHFRFLYSHLFYSAVDSVWFCKTEQNFCLFV